MAKHKPTQFWTAHVAAAQASGTSKANYCRQYGVDYKTLLLWISRFRRRDQAAPSAQSLVPVAIRESAPLDRSTMMLRIGPDISLSMSASTDVVCLGTLFRTVSAC